MWRVLLVATRREQHAPEVLELFETLTGAERHGVEWVVRDPDGHAGLVAQANVEAPQQGSAAGQDDALFHDVGGELGGRLVEGELHRIHDGRDRLLDGFADLVGRGDDGLG